MSKSEVQSAEVKFRKRQKDAGLDDPDATLGKK